MKSKRKSRLLAGVLCAALGVLAPAAALADMPDNPAGATVEQIPAGGQMSENAGTVKENGGILITNAATGVVITNTNNIATNNGRVETNDYEIMTNNGTVTTSKGVIITNNGTVGSQDNNTIRTNNGVVNQMNAAGTISTNTATGRVYGCDGAVPNNYGRVDVEGVSGIVGTNHDGGVVNLFEGYVTTNESGGVVNNYGKRVTTNNVGGVVNNYGGTVTTNNGTVNEFYPVTAIGGENAEITGLESAVSKAWIQENTGEATIKPKAGYRLKSAPTAVNATVEKVTDNEYRLKGVTGDVTLTVETQPVIVITGQPQSVGVTAGCVTEKLSVAATLPGGSPITYQWYASDGAGQGNAIPGEVGASYALPGDLAIGTHHYFCRLSAAGAEPVDTDVVTVTVSATAAQPGDPAAPSGDPAAQAGNPGGGENPSFGENPNTGDGSAPFLLILTALVAGGGAVMLGKKRGEARR